MFVFVAEGGIYKYWYRVFLDDDAEDDVVDVVVDAVANLWKGKYVNVGIELWNILFRFSLIILLYYY